MRTRPALLAVLTCLAWVGAAYAITWTLDTGSSQGWVAREWGLTPDWRQALRCELEGGIWRAMVNAPLTDEAPNVELVSPEIQAPAVLFDELRVQARLVHHEDIEGSADVWVDLSGIPDVSDTS